MSYTRQSFKPAPPVVAVAPIPQASDAAPKQTPALSTGTTAYYDREIMLLERGMKTERLILNRLNKLRDAAYLHEQTL